MMQLEMTNLSGFQPSIGLRVVCLLTSSAATIGCAAGIRSTPLNDGNKNIAADGLVYFLPERDATVTVTVSVENGVREETVEIVATDPRPDLKKAFAVTIPRNWAGLNEATIQVSDKGLLDSESKTETTSSLTDILKAAAGLAGIVSTQDVKPIQAGQDCPVGDWKKTMSLPIGPAEFFCGYRIEEKAGSDGAPTAGSQSSDEKPAKGLFYRVQLPHTVTATRIGSGGVEEFQKRFVVFSPSGSKSHLLPLAGSAFGTNSATFVFDQGVPTKYHQNIGNEIQGVLGAPAAVLQSYFAAIGTMFGSKETAVAAEADYLNQVNALEIAKTKNDVCAEVAKASVDLAAIKAACGSN